MVFKEIKMSKSPYDINADETFIDASNKALRKQLSELMFNIHGTREGDIDALHDMRVASRRLRAAMSIFKPAYPAKEFCRLEREAARVTDALGAVRDSDVQIDYFEDVAKDLQPAEQVGVNALVDYLKDERDNQRDELLKELDRLESSSFEVDFYNMLGSKSNGGDK